VPCGTPPAALRPTCSLGSRSPGSRRNPGNHRSRGSPGSHRSRGHHNLGTRRSRGSLGIRRSHRIRRCPAAMR
jgi:hypothetical protein